MAILLLEGLASVGNGKRREGKYLKTNNRAEWERRKKSRKSFFLFRCGTCREKRFELYNEGGRKRKNVKSSQPWKGKKWAWAPLLFHISALKEKEKRENLLPHFLFALPVWKIFASISFIPINCKLQHAITDTGIVCLRWKQPQKRKTHFSWY